MTLFNELAAGEGRAFDYSVFRMPQHEVDRTIKHIEDNYPVRVLALAECSSRAWGYATESSDHDLRAVCLPLPWLQDVSTSGNDNLRIHVDSQIDVQCYMLRNAFHLARDTNLSIYEFLYSPIHYQSAIPVRGYLGDNVVMALKKVLNHYYSEQRMFDTLRGNLSRVVRNKISEGRAEKVAINLTQKDRVKALRFAQMLLQCADSITVEVTLDKLFSKKSADVIRSSLSYGSDEALSSEALRAVWDFQNRGDKMIVESLYIERPASDRPDGFQFVDDTYRETARLMFSYFAKYM